MKELEYRLVTWSLKLCQGICITIAKTFQIKHGFMKVILTHGKAKALATLFFEYKLRLLYWDKEDYCYKKFGQVHKHFKKNWGMQ